MSDFIDWDNLSSSFADLRRNVGQVAIRNRNVDHLQHPAAKKSRVNHNLDINISTEKFPEVDPEQDRLEDPARFLIDGVQAKVFFGAIEAMSRFTDTLLFFPNREGLTVKACNNTRTAAGSLTFCHNFFGAIRTFDFPNDEPCCRVYVKHILPVLKKAEKSKQLETLILDMDPNSENMVIRMGLRNGISRYYRLSLTDVLLNSLPKIIQRTGEHNFIAMTAIQLNEALSIVGQDAHNIGFWCSHKDIIFHTVFQPSYSLDARVRKGAIRISNCIDVCIKKMVNFSFAAKELRGLTRFASKYNSTITLYFRNSKYPMFAVLDIMGICNTVFTITANRINETENGLVLKQMIAEVDLNLEIATQDTVGVGSSIISLNLQSKSCAEQSPFEPVDISQSHPLVQAFANELRDDYWRNAIAVREIEEVEID